MGKSQAPSPCRSTKRNIAIRSLKRVTSRSCLRRRWLRDGGGPTLILTWGRATGGLTAVPIGVLGRIAGNRGVEKGFLLTHPPRRAETRLHQASFSRHSETQRTRSCTPRLFVRCGLAKRPF